MSKLSGQVKRRHHTGPVPDLATNALGKLTAQAKLQVLQRDSGIPQYEIADPQPLTQLPEPDPGDFAR